MNDIYVFRITGTLESVEQHEADPTDQTQAIIIQLQTPPAGETPPPGLRMVTLATDQRSLNIRNAPRISGIRVGTLMRNNLPAIVLEEQREGDDIWLRVGINQWCAERYSGTTYLTTTP